MVCNFWRGREKVSSFFTFCLTLVVYHLADYVASSGHIETANDMAMTSSFCGPGTVNTSSFDYNFNTGS